MTERKVNEILKKAHIVYDQLALEKDIQSISEVLLQLPFDRQQARMEISEINMKYPENTIIFNLIFPPQGSGVPLDAASDQSLICDLRWKRACLQVIRVGKTFAELFEEFSKSTT